MDLETKDYRGSERRNGGKLRLSGLDWFRVGKWAIGLIILSVVAWTTLKLNVGALAEDVSEIQAKNKQQDEDVISMKEDIAVIKNEVTNIQKRQEKLEDNDTIQTQLLYEIKGLVSTFTDTN